MSNIKVLTLGWEFPPLVNGGLGIACLGLSKALAKKVDLRVIVPKADPSVHTDGFQLTGLNNVSYREVEQVDRKYSYESFAMVEHAPIELDPYTTVEGESGMIQFTQEGRISFSRTHEADLQLFKNKEDLYAGDLALKVIQFSKIAAKIAMQQEFDVIHAHDWMTYLAGVEVKKATGKPLVVHLHASQFDRAGADARGWIYDIEKFGMEQADAVIPVSKYTGTVASGHYAIDPHKIFPIHNGADPVQVFKGKKKFPEKLVLFLGRLTAQKGPGFFLQIAAKVLEQTDDVRFVMAGTGEKLRQLIESGAFKGVGDKFHFTGYLLHALRIGTLRPLRAGSGPVQHSRGHLQAVRRGRSHERRAEGGFLGRQQDGGTHREPLHGRRAVPQGGGTKHGGHQGLHLGFRSRQGHQGL